MYIHNNNYHMSQQL